jgi:hypothetical protein
VAADVDAVRVLWSCSGALAGTDVRAQLKSYADALAAAYAAQDPGAAVLIKNWWRPEVDGPLSGELGEREARLIVARDHGFDAWSSVSRRCDTRFESAVDAVVDGRTCGFEGTAHRRLVSCDASLPCTATAPPFCTTRPQTAWRSDVRPCPRMPRPSQGC